MIIFDNRIWFKPEAEGVMRQHGFEKGYGNGDGYGNGYQGYEIINENGKGYGAGAGYGNGLGEGNGDF
jgi:hypothetical protein